GANLVSGSRDGFKGRNGETRRTKKNQSHWLSRATVRKNDEAKISRRDAEKTNRNFSLRSLRRCLKFLLILNFHRGYAHSPAFTSLLILRLIRSRFSGLMWLM